MDDKKSLSERGIITKYILQTIETFGWDKQALEYAETGIENKVQREANRRLEKITLRNQV